MNENNRIAWVGVGLVGVIWIVDIGLIIGGWK